MENIKVYLAKEQLHTTKKVINNFMDTAKGLNNYYAVNELKQINKMLDMVLMTLNMEDKNYDN